ncbi:hypothetical protein EMCG_04267 [[Emmonsia] crescens]|uniref:FAD dependent oxidoreductase domain-containing protein n=1 Tax=[Emmonsia] crescens TaxID=73230 RepID=A0A0G2HSM0_9EURO|nr:hypothetical protein EMCG_04267 [Emmonsia crescens UAMH 3008]
MAESYRPLNRVIPWEDISPRPEPLRTPSESSSRILVIGGGVTSLITSWVLLDKGYHVTIVSKEWASWTDGQRITSQIAGALWEFPPAACGMHTDVISLDNSKRWSMVSYRIFCAMADDPEISTQAGVRLRRSDFFFPYSIEKDVEQHNKMLEIQQAGVRGFQHNKQLVQDREINPTFGAVDAYEHLAPIIDTDHAMLWLMNLVQAKGAKLVNEAIHGSLHKAEDALLARFKADAIVNATGLGAIELADDKTCYPLRGGVLRVINDGTDFPQITTALTMSADALHNLNEIVFIVPRNDNILLLGSIAQPDEWHLGGLTLETPIIQRMRKRCEDFLPVLQSARLDPEYPIAQGLRPFRGNNVRVERELRPKFVKGSPKPIPSRIIHTYGQGGAGWSLSFGCAGDVGVLVAEALADQTPIPMAMSDGNMPATAHSLQSWRAML